MGAWKRISGINQLQEQLKSAQQNQHDLVERTISTTSSVYDVPRPPIKVESGFSTPTIDVEDPKYGFSIYNQNDAINSNKFEDNYAANFQSEMIHERILSPEITSDSDT